MDKRHVIHLSFFLEKKINPIQKIHAPTPPALKLATPAALHTQTISTSAQA